jgi:hypothetical protein
MSKMRFIGLWMSTRVDCGSSGGAEWRSPLAGSNPKPSGINSQTGRKAGTGQAVEGLLRSGSEQVSFVLAVDTLGREL